MRVYMQTPAVAEAPLRYYQLLLQKDLLEGWTLIRESGRQDAAGRIRRDHFATREEAEQALVKAWKMMSKRGYRVVFVQGETLAEK